MLLSLCSSFIGMVLERAPRPRPYNSCPCIQVIVEAVKPEWDGGSRGKVKTKGKRGKGFV